MFLKGTLHYGYSLLMRCIANSLPDIVDVTLVAMPPLVTGMLGVCVWLDVRRHFGEAVAQVKCH